MAYWDSSSSSYRIRPRGRNTFRRIAVGTIADQIKSTGRQLFNLAYERGYPYAIAAGSNSFGVKRQKISTPVKTNQMPAIPPKNIFNNFNPTPRMSGRKRGNSVGSTQRSMSLTKEMQISNLPGAYGGVFKGAPKKDSRAKVSALKKGCYLQWETGNTLSNPDALTLVHAFPNRELGIATVYGWLRNWSQKTHDKIWTIQRTVFSDIFGTSDARSIYITYYPQNISTTPSRDQLYVSTGPGTDDAIVISQIVYDALAVILRTNAQIQLHKIEVTNEVGTVLQSDSFKGLNVSYQGSYVCSVQSVNSSTGVNQNPNEVVMYTGKGNGPSPKFERTDQYSSFVAGQHTGFTTQTPNTSDDIGGESWSASSFSNCKVKSSTLLYPGQIKKSVIAVTGTSNVAKLFKQLAGFETDGAQQFCKSTFGYYKMYHFEGMISKTEGAVNLDLEWNFKVAAVVTSRQMAVMPETSVIAPF